MMIIKKTKHNQINIRKCFICKQHFVKKSLIRLIINKANELEIDMEQKKFGRGYYFCRNKQHINKIFNKKILEKIFKIKISLDFYNILKKHCLKINI